MNYTKQALFIILLVAIETNVLAKGITIDKLDSLIVNALELSEQALFASNFGDAEAYLDASYFENLSQYEVKHEIMLTIERVRVQSFKSRLYNRNFRTGNPLEILLKLLPAAKRLGEKSIQADYFTTLSAAYRSNNLDSCEYYEDKALSIYRKLNDLKSEAELRATQLSRTVDGYFDKDQKGEAIALIPKFQKEILFAEKHSKYALAYNTRHLANIYRIYEIDMTEALNLYQQSLSLREEIGFTPFVCASHYSVGIIYAELGEFDLAIEAFKRSLSSAQEANFVRYKVQPLFKIGDIYAESGNKEMATEVYTEALKIAAESNFTLGISEALKKLGLL